MIFRYITTALFVFTTSSAVFSQGQITRNQISINASKFVLIFNEQVNNLDLSYRYSLDSLYGIRGAGSVDIENSDDAINDYSVRLGIDRIFKRSGNWKFYTGIDFNYTRTNAKSAMRVTTKAGGIFFLGFMHHFGKHFSISTEPSLAIFRKKVEDKDSFNPDANSTSTSFDLINIGQIRVDFHF